MTCHCGKPIKTTGGLCEDCYAESQQHAVSSRTGMCLRERVKFGLYQAEDNQKTGGAWRHRGRRVKK